MYEGVGETIVAAQILTVIAGHREVREGKGGGRLMRLSVCSDWCKIYLILQLAEVFADT